MYKCFLQILSNLQLIKYFSPLFQQLFYDFGINSLSLSELQSIFSNKKVTTKMLFKITFKEETHLMKMKKGQSFADLKYHTEKAFKKLPSNYCYVYLDEDGDEINLDNEHDFQSLSDSGATKIPISIKECGESAQSTMIKIQSQLKYQTKSQISVQSSSSDLKQEKMILEVKKEMEEIKQIEVKQVQIPLKVQNQPVKDQNLQKMKHNFVHKDVKCDICNVDTIIGIRYKCSVCDDYDLCESCEGVYDHDHAFIKIKYDGQKFAKEPLTAIEVIGTTVITGAQILKQGYKTAVKTIRKLSGKQEAKPKKLEDNLLAAIDIIKPLQQKKEVVEKKVQKIDLSQQQKLIKKGQYLSDILGIDFSRCYAFALKNPTLPKQDLVVKYFNNVGAI